MSASHQVYFASLPIITSLSTRSIAAVVRNSEALLELHERIAVKLDFVNAELSWKGAEDGVRDERLVCQAAGRIAEIFNEEVSTTTFGVEAGTSQNKNTDFAYCYSFQISHSTVVSVLYMARHSTLFVTSSLAPTGQLMSLTAPMQPTSPSCRPLLCLFSPKPPRLLPVLP